MTEDESKRYDEEMRKGHYLTGLDIVLKAQAREEGRSTSDEDVYAPIMDEIFGGQSRRIAPSTATRAERRRG